MVSFAIVCVQKMTDVITADLRVISGGYMDLIFLSF